MNNDFLHKTNKPNNKKNFFTLLINQLFFNMPKNCNDLLMLLYKLEQKKIITPISKNIIENILNLSKKRLKDIMIPRTQMITLKKNKSITEYIDIISRSSCSSFPVIDENKDYVEGILVIQDILPFIYNKNKFFNVEKILRPAIIVPENQRVDRMLQEFKSKYHHMAIVINEFGGVSGLITINDIVENILGIIKDKYTHTYETDIKQLNNHLFKICALTSIKTFNNVFKTNFNEKEIDTVGGLVMQSFGHLPMCGENINIAGYNFTVIMVDNQRIIQLHVQIPESSVLSINKN